MANRKPHPRMTSKTIPKIKRGNSLTTKELLRYLVKPLHLPHFDFSTFTSEHFLVETIRKLLIEAAVDGILPTKVVGVQFIFAKRSNRARQKTDEEVEGNFSFPLLLCCRDRKQALGISDGMAYVTQLLTSHKSSFHLRVRKFKVIHAPAVCVFSIFDPEQHPKFDSTNVLWVRLPTKGDFNNQITFPAKNLTDLDRHFDGRRFYESDINVAVNSGYFDESKSSSVIDADSFSVRTIGESHLSVDVRQDRLEALRLDIARDMDYLTRVSYLLNFGDVILCTPHAYDIRSSSSGGSAHPNETITDAGLTVITDRTKGKITEDDWLRVQAVAQKLAIFAGAAVSTATEARENILHTLNDVFAHEFSNASMAIVAYLEKLRKKKSPLSPENVRDIQGRLQFTQTLIDSSVWFYEGATATLDTLLSALIAPMLKYHDLYIDDLDYAMLVQYEVMGLWQLVLAEALRNAYKHCLIDGKDNKKHIHVSIHSGTNHVTVSIKNRAKRDFRMDPNREGWAFMQRIASSLEGTVTPAEDKNLFSVNIEMPLI